MSSRILFVLKQRSGTSGLSSGLANSVRFVVDMLNKAHFPAKSVEVVDNNAIHREVCLYQPTHVIIEALWVVPEKFEILHKLHPGIQWIVRGHSEMPFLAGEGVAMEWIDRYVKIPNVVVAFNSESSVHDIRVIVAAANPGWNRKQVEGKVRYLPNYYPAPLCFPRSKNKDDQFVDVACFGAVRPLKNHLLQAVAAIEYAEFWGRTLRFHINGTRCEQGGINVLRNLRALFASTKHELVEHGWYDHKQFLGVLSGMSFGLQISFSETFNIVAADMVSSGLPVVTSSEISWVSKWCHACTTDSKDIFSKMMRMNDWRLKLALRVSNLRGLRRYSENSKEQWLKYLSK